MTHRIRVGLVAWNALPAIVNVKDDRQTRTFGGMETAMWTLARRLAEHDDLSVTAYVTADTPRNAAEKWPAEIDKVILRVFPDRYRKIRQHVGDCIDWSARRVKRWDASLLWQLPLLAITKPLRHPDVDACRPDPRLANEPIDFWISFGNHVETSRVIAHANAGQTPSAISIQSNGDLAERLAKDESGDEINDYGEPDGPRRFALRHASEIWCQTETQLDISNDLFGLPSVLVRNPINIRDWLLDPVSNAQDCLARGRVLWIGRFDDFHKRPLLMMEAARKCSDIPFTMIINPMDAEVEERVRRNVPANVDIVDRVDFQEMPTVFRQARVFVSTGSATYEGFPNVLLQAAASGTPIVSLVDHDHFLQRSGAGIACDDSLDRFSNAIRSCWESDPVDHESVASYLLKHHDSDAVAKLVRQRIVSAVQGSSKVAGVVGA